MALYAATIALSAFLLFLVQPLIARQILPWFGGSAAVWTTCMVFFQTVLLAGYAYSDVLVRRLEPRRQAWLHGALLVASLAFLPILPSEAFRPPDPDQPVLRILLLLAATIGLPYFMLSTTGPLVQAWFTRRYRAARVYRLYALSNVASMAALAAYPPLIEPNATGRMQSIGWSVAYAAFVALAAAAAWLSLRGAGGAEAARFENSPADARAGNAAEGPGAQAGKAASAATSRAASQPGTANPNPAASGAPDAPPLREPSLREQLLWLALAALGSVLLLSVTTHITQNVASIPFLWILPLAIYLVSFILCFDGSGWYLRSWYGPLAAALAVLMMAGLQYRLTDALALERGILHIEEAVPLYAFGLFVLCMFFHGELVARKPAPLFLTRFYLMVSAGGALGGVLVGLVAPLVFSSYWELPIALLAGAILVAALADGTLRVLAGLAAAACAGLFFSYAQFLREDTVAMTRSFYGTLRVKATAPDTDENAKWRLLHGVITHGEQYRSPRFSALPTTYYGEDSGVGRAIAGLRAIEGARPQRVGLVGAGIGTLAAYGEPGDVYRVYELNPQVLELARDRFSYLSASRASVETVLGDARLMLEREPPQAFDVLAVDAFSSDSIPIHLITREAMQLYASHLRPGGVVAFHISNRYLDLSAVVRQLADSVGWQAIRVIDDPGPRSYLYRSDWVLVTANARLAERLLLRGPGERIEPRADLAPWTDDFHNLFQVLK